MSFMRILMRNGWIRDQRDMFNFTNSSKMEIFKDILKAIYSKIMSQYSTSPSSSIPMPAIS